MSGPEDFNAVPPVHNESVETSSITLREDAISALKKFVEKSGGDPAGLDLQDPEVIAAENLVEKWKAARQNEVAGNPVMEEAYNFEMTMLYIDAGFVSKNYLSEVLGWLYQDAENIPKDTDNPESIALRQDLANAIRKIRALLL